MNNDREAAGVESLAADDYARIHSVCERFEDSRQGDTPQPIEGRLAEVSEPLRPHLLRELVMREVELRRGRGETPTPEEYWRRFPRHGAEVEHAFRETSSDRTPAELTAPHVSAAMPAVALPDRYEALGVLGRGGMGLVLGVRDRRLGRVVALKTVLADAAWARRRFEREARITARIQHPGVAPVHDVGELPDGRPYLTMKRIEGRTLAAMPEERPTPGHDLPRLVAIFEQVAQAVAYAHSRRVIHRDLKPSNIMLGPYGETLVVDWGLAKCFGVADAAGSEHDAPLRPAALEDLGATTTGSVSGTPAFMSPEQAAGRPALLGPATDFYSLGATLYAILTGRAPFDGDSLVALLDRVKAGRLTPPRAIEPATPRALEAICLKAMALRPEDRYATATALAEDLERWLGDVPVTAWREPPAERVRRLVRRHRAWVWSSAIALVAILLGLGVAMAVVSAQNVALEKERRRAGGNAYLLLQGLTESLKRLANPALAGDPEGRESVLQALTEAEAIYGELLESERAAGVPPSNLADYWIHTALLRTAAGDRAGTREAYGRALELNQAEIDADPGRARAWSGMAGTRTHLGLELWVQGSHGAARDYLSRASQEFRRALDLDPDDPGIQRTAAWLHVFCPDPDIRDERLALELAGRFVEQASAQGRDRPRFSEGIRPLLTLALAQYRVGDWAAARATIEESIRRKAARLGGLTLEQLDETGRVIDAYDWFVWSMALARLGEQEAARRQFDGATRWMRVNRYGDFELQLLHEEAAELLGVSAPDGG
jgi:tetratricopeptide (TPR) repeat protein